ncbi:MAG: YraN family protein [Bacteroidia bacterium]|nr:YraN family protein [Bacteroidia bacterium]
MAEHNKLGMEGEKRAENYLLAKGHRILERNWRSTHKELDLITEVDGWLVIIEVKTRTGNTWEPPENAVNHAKIKRITQAAHHYVRLHRIDAQVRFDIISIVYEQGVWAIDHFEDAFLSPHK